MELKKNPKVDPKRNSLLFFQIGLVAMLALTYFGIEMKTMDPVVETDEGTFADNLLSDDDEEVIITLPPVQKLPPPPPPAPEVITVVEDEIEIEQEEIETTEVEESKPVVVVTASEVGGDPNAEPVEIDEELPFAVIEQVPLFPGCEKVSKAEQPKCFQEKLDEFVKKNFRMPDDLESGYKARVAVMFVIDKQGNITNITPAGGNSDLQKEALRVFSKAPKLSPGKQRGKPVKCKFTYPIVIRTQ